MGLYSPESEKSQLNMDYIPKNDSQSIFKSLNQNVKLNDNNSNNNRSHLNMSDYGNSSPYGRSYDARINQNPQSNGNGRFSGSIDSLVDEHIIPSPPLSPKLESKFQQHDESSHVSSPALVGAAPKGPAENVLFVRPAWPNGLTRKRYRYATYGFLSQYKIFSNLAHPYSKNIINRYNNLAYNARHKYFRYDDEVTPSSSRLPSPLASPNLNRQSRYNMRKQVFFNNNLSKFESDTEWMPRKRKVYSPQRRTMTTSPHRSKKFSPSASAPHTNIASIEAIHEAPQYIPNVSWKKLPDFSPSLSTLPADTNKSLKIEWKGSPMDLSLDPLKNELHPAELILAQTLRLPCDLYLDSKRRLFLEKVYRLRKGLPFRRTDAQKACRIDVNKASRLFQAFEKVGWLRDSNFTKYL
ncbi:Fun19p SKDI_01G0370 [Saccharomyces kudriavzevii IFO 1802]|uniref:Uncharacterized protein n=2 Tax=Saccharomyces kudriavzevii (strain ATCC MYA-4449 / AS 2.2408 / CBS 8840 / NBRC 1802 / NCYC 2889) TaxID=226230 RepID=A0AA35JA45_SACK1|nr:uncharacterized protein SKDI_01G0370 [Saccharomyces kudriavzevii IFO 1802]EJT43456.1 FUN19-like protein [Saccharomyces kudriavzevii IFO 1802]CAI4054487.1 hypothetical protein SKDI_01G0370 [Saccharomyces kudriavzevii IFO 1802]